MFVLVHVRARKGDDLQDGMIFQSCVHEGDLRVYLM